MIIKIKQHDSSEWHCWAIFPYRDDVVAIVKAIPGTIWDKQMRAWALPIDAVASFIEQIKEADITVQIDMNHPGLNGHETV